LIEAMGDGGAGVAAEGGHGGGVVCGLGISVLAGLLADDDLPEFFGHLRDQRGRFELIHRLGHGLLEMLALLGQAKVEAFDARCEFSGFVGQFGEPIVGKGYLHIGIAGIAQRGSQRADFFAPSLDAFAWQGVSEDRQGGAKPTTGHAHLMHGFDVFRRPNRRCQFADQPDAFGEGEGGEVANRDLL